MANYIEIEELLRSYENLLENVKYCINLLEYLESGRNRWTWIPDWVVGERRSINMSRTKKYLEKLEKEVAKAVTLYTELFSLMTSATMIERPFPERNQELENSELTILQMVSNFSNRISTAVDRLNNTEMFMENDIEPLLNSVLQVGAARGIVVAGGMFLGAAAAGALALGATGGALALGATGGALALGATGGALALGATGSALALGATGGALALGATGGAIALGTTGGALALGATGGAIALGATGGALVLAETGGALALGITGGALALGTTGGVLALETTTGGVLALGAAGGALALGTTGGALALGITGGALALGAAGGALALGTTGSALALGATGGALALGATGCAAIGSVAAAGVIGCKAYLYAHSKGKGRGMKYQELKFLSDALNDMTLLSEFESQNIFLTQAIKGLKENIDLYNQQLALNSRGRNNPDSDPAISQTNTRSSATVDDGNQQK